MKDIPVIGFEGMHRTGKGTQIDLVKKSLEKEGFNVFVIRGEGSRKGENKSDLYFDPESIWFKEINKKLRVKNKEGKYDIELWRESSRRIQREIFIWSNKILNGSTAGFGKTIILFDRTIISRFFLDFQEDTNIDLKELLFFNQGKNGNGTKLKVFLPEIIFLFSTDNNTLLSRLGNDNSSKNQDEMRKKNIINGNDLYGKMLSNLPKDVEKRLFYVDASEEISTIKSIILEQIKKIISK